MDGILVSTLVPAKDFQPLAMPRWKGRAGRRVNVLQHGD